MTTGRLPILALLAVAVVGLTVAPIGAATPTDDAAAQEEPAPTDGENSSMGMAMSAFMQSSSAGAEERVESGMFVAGYERADADRRADLVAQRTRGLENRLTELEAERDRLEAELAERNESAPLLEARVARLTVRTDGFEAAVNETRPRAAAVGVDAERLDSLRSAARAFAGERVAAIASELAGFGSQRGPLAGFPDWAGGPNGGDGDGPGGGPGDAANGTDDVGPGNGTPGNGPDEVPGNPQTDRSGDGMQSVDGDGSTTDADATDDASAD